MKRIIHLGTVQERATTEFYTLKWSSTTLHCEQASRTHLGVWH